MSVGQVTITVPPNRHAGGVYAERVDATVHFKNEPGAMEDFIDFVEGQREDGQTVELRTDANRTYPIADVKADEYRLTVFGPHFTTGEEEERDRGEEATRLAIQSRIEMDNLGDELEAAKEEDE